MSIIPLVIPLSPGVSVTEDAAGFIPVEIADHSAVYLVGTATVGAFSTPTLTISPEDFTNQFGISDSLESVTLFFKNNPNGRLWFSRCQTADVTDPRIPVLSELTACITASFNEEMSLGFLICPEGFAKLTTPADKTALAHAMRDKCELLHWLAIADCSEATDTVAEAQTEGTAIVSAKGHVAYYAPYVIAENDDVVPPSGAIAGIAARRIKEQGFVSVPAGIKFPVKGVKGLTKKFTRTEQDVLNPLNINLIRDLPNRGIVSWGARLRSNSEYYRFWLTRVIFNVYNRTLQEAFDELIFDVNDGQGALLQRIRQTAHAVSYRLWKAGAFYGATPDEAFQIIVDERNNPVIDLEAGIVRLDCYAAPSPILERLAIRTIRTTIGQVQSVVEGIG